MKTFHVTIQHVVSYRLTVEAKDADAAEQAACDSFGESDDGLKELFSAVDIIGVEECAP